MSRSVLVTGGAGYIGGHAVLSLLDAGWRVVVLDDLSTGTRSDVAAAAAFVEGNVADSALVARVLRDHAVEAVIHFAGSIDVHESTIDPLKYYRNNTCASRNLVECCLESPVRRFLFSSTAAAYGNAELLPIPEEAPVVPINPYGWSKVMTEQILRDIAGRNGMSVGVLRYFNVAGADPQVRAGQRSKKATHLIKIACELVTGKRASMNIYGTDYPTADGTCVRDYIHVSDLADAHMRVLDWLDRDRTFEVLNCGYGHGYSVREVLQVVEKVCGRKLDIREAERRPGDPAALVAGTRRLRELTGWTPRHDDLELIVRTALAWEAKIA